MSSRKTIALSIAVSFVEWTTFKIIYPRPDFRGDSYLYIAGAREHLNINILSTGYSKFLEFLPFLTHSGIGLVTFQFIILELSIYYFYHILINQYKMNKETKISLFLFLFCNPLFLYTSNYVAPDALILALSLFWFSEILQILQKTASYNKIFFVGVTLSLIFAFGEGVIIFLIASIASLIISKQDRIKKIIGATLLFLFVFSFITYSRYNIKSLLGKPETSLLANWQIANNALYVRGQISIDKKELPTNACRILDSISNLFFQKLGPGFNTYLNRYEGDYFLQNKNAPLYTFIKTQSRIQDIKTMGLASITFKDYGQFIVKEHPLAFLWFYAWPNLRHYFKPTLGNLSTYNQGSDTIRSLGKTWFAYNDNHTNSKVENDLQSSILQIFPYVFLAINILLLPSCLASALTTKRLSHSHPTKKLYFTLCFYATYCFLSITKSAASLSKELFIFTILFSLIALLIEAMNFGIVHQKQLKIEKKHPKFKIENPKFG